MIERKLLNSIRVIMMVVFAALIIVALLNYRGTLVIPPGVWIVCGLLAAALLLVQTTLVLGRKEKARWLILMITLGVVLIVPLFAGLIAGLLPAADSLGMIFWFVVAAGMGLLAGIVYAACEIGGLLGQMIYPGSSEEILNRRKVGDELAARWFFWLRLLGIVAFAAAVWLSRKDLAQPGIRLITCGIYLAGVLIQLLYVSVVKTSDNTLPVNIGVFLSYLWPYAAAIAVPLLPLAGNWLTFGLPPLAFFAGCETVWMIRRLLGK